MAEAILVVPKIQREVVTIIEENGSPEVTLKLSEKEAIVLKTVLGQLGGSLDGPREVTGHIYEILARLALPKRRIFIKQNNYGTVIIEYEQ